MYVVRLFFFEGRAILFSVECSRPTYLLGEDLQGRILTQPPPPFFPSLKTPETIESKQSAVKNGGAAAISGQRIHVMPESNNSLMGNNKTKPCLKWPPLTRVA